MYFSFIVNLILLMGKFHKHNKKYWLLKTNYKQKMYLPYFIT